MLSRVAGEGAERGRCGGRTSSAVRGFRGVARSGAQLLQGRGYGAPPALVGKGGEPRDFGGGGEGRVGGGEGRAVARAYAGGVHGGSPGRRGRGRPRERSRGRGARASPRFFAWWYPQSSVRETHGAERILDTLSI